MNFSLIHSVLTVVMFILFIGIIVWAWSAKRKRGFDEAARIPLEEDDVQGSTNVAGGRKPRATDAVSTRPSGEKSHV